MFYVEDDLKVELVKLENGDYLHFEWRDVVGFEGYFMVSNYGQVKSLPRRFTKKDGKVCVVKGKVLRPYSNRHGYLSVKLYKHRASKVSKLVHRLVAESFLESYQDDLVVDHLDRNPKNPTLNNLRVISQENNLRYSRPLRGRTSRYKGVHWSSEKSRWRAAITSGDGGKIWLGTFKNERNAARAYNEAAKDRYGIYAYLNDISSEFEPEPKNANSSRSVLCVTTGRIYPSLRKAASDLKLGTLTIKNSCETKTPVNGLLFEFIN